MNARLLFACLLGYTSLFLLSSCSGPRSEPRRIENGSLNLRDHDFAREAPVRLDGSWYFSWRRFLAPQSGRKLTGTNSPEKTATNFDLPAPWEGATNAGEPLGRYGFASYRLKISLPEGHPDMLALRLPDMTTAFRLFVNGREVAVNGIPGSSRETERPRWRPQFVSFPVTTDELEFVLHVSNWNYIKSGIFYSIQLGSVEGIQRAWLFAVIMDLLLLGSILIMGLYYLTFFFLRGKEKPPLYFSIFCLLFAVRILFTGEKLAIQISPNFSWEWAVTLEYISYYLSVPAFFYYVRSVFPRETRPDFARFIMIYAAVFAAATVALPARYFSEGLNFFNIVVPCAGIYLIYAVFRAVQRRRSGALIFLAGLTILFAVTINDILYSLLWLRTTQLAPVGIICFILAQSFLLSQRFSRAINLSEELSQNLEKEVLSRTEELRAINEISKKLNATVDPYAILREVAGFVNERFGIDGYLLYLVNPRDATLEYFDSNFPEGLSEEARDRIRKTVIPLDPGGGVHYFPFKRKRRVFLNRIRPSNFDFDNFVHRHYGFASYLMIPLINKGRVIGIIDFSGYHGKRMRVGNQDLELIEQFCEHLAGAIQSANLVEMANRLQIEARVEQIRSDQAAQEARMLNKIAREVNSTVNLERIMDIVIEHVESYYDIEGVMLQLADHDAGVLRYFRTNFNSEQHAAADLEWGRRLTFPLDRGLSGKIIKRGRPMYFPHFTRRELSQDDPLIGFVNRLGLHSALVVPMFVQEKVVGMMYLSSFSKQLKLSRDNIDSMAGFCEVLAGALQTSRLLGAVESERNKSDELLRNILPEQIATELKNKGLVKPVLFDSVSIMFTDFKGFTSSASRMQPGDLVEELDQIFEQFDLIMEKYNLEKLKTIGDAYMAAGGLPGPNRTHPVDAVLAGLEIQALMKQIRLIREEAAGEDFWELRLGIHTGPVVAGVIGKNKFAYDVWGDAVNVASRMESGGEPGRINVSAATFAQIRDFFVGEARGSRSVKNRGEMEMYFIDRIRPELSLDPEGMTPNERFQEMLARLRGGNVATASGRFRVGLPQ